MNEVSKQTPKKVTSHCTLVFDAVTTIGGIIYAFKVIPVNVCASLSSHYVLSTDSNFGAKKLHLFYPTTYFEVKCFSKCVALSKAADLALDNNIIFSVIIFLQLQ